MRCHTEPTARMARILPTKLSADLPGNGEQEELELEVHRGAMNGIGRRLAESSTFERVWLRRSPTLLLLGRYRLISARSTSRARTAFRGGGRPRIHHQDDEDDLVPSGFPSRWFALDVPSAHGRSEILNATNTRCSLL